MKNTNKRKSILDIINGTSIYTLTTISYLLPLLIIIIWAFVVEKIFIYQVAPIYGYALATLSIFIAGTGGLFQVIKKESPWIMGKTIKGLLAVISGIILMILFWGVGLLCIYFLILEFVIR